MDSNTVNKQIRTEIRPFLKESGFTHFTGRNSWRYAGTRVDVVNFQSFNSYNASVMGCTTYSFAVNVGERVSPQIHRLGQRMPGKLVQRTCESVTLFADAKSAPLPQAADARRWTAEESYGNSI